MKPAEGEVASDAPQGQPAAGEPPMTLGRFLSALAVACLLLFLTLIVMAIAGLGPFGVVPAVVVAMALTARVTGVRRPLMLLALGVLSLVIVVGITYGVAIATILNASAGSGSG
jgi:hypothetical protein